MMCQNCQEREGTHLWVGDGGMLAYVHGGGVRWCEVCVLTAQLEHARQAAERIPELERQLANASAARAPEARPQP